MVREGVTETPRLGRAGEILRLPLRPILKKQRSLDEIHVLFLQRRASEWASMYLYMTVA